MLSHTCQVDAAAPSNPATHPPASAAPDMHASGSGKRSLFGGIKGKALHNTAAGTAPLPKFSGAALLPTNKSDLSAAAGGGSQQQRMPHLLAQNPNDGGNLSSIVVLRVVPMHLPLTFANSVHIHVLPSCFWRNCINSRRHK